MGKRLRHTRQRDATVQLNSSTATTGTTVGKRSRSARKLCVFFMTAATDRQRQRPSKLLQEFDRVIGFHSVYVDLTGNHTAALMLSQVKYWWMRRADKADEWFYKTLAEWYEETRLTRRQLDRATDTLMSLGFIDVKRMGANGMLHFHLHEKALEKALLKAFNLIPERPRRIVQKGQTGLYKRDIRQKVHTTKGTICLYQRDKPYIGRQRLHIRLLTPLPPTLRVGGVNRRRVA